MLVIDPLKYKIHNLLIQGESFPLNNARQGYGTKEDIEELLSIINDNVENREIKYFFVDFTPFDRIGHFKDVFIPGINKIKTSTPVIMIMSDTVYLEALQWKSDIFAVIVVFSEEGEIKEIINKEKFSKGIIQLIENQLLITKNNYVNIKEFRVEPRDRNLSSLLFKQGCLDIPCRSDDIDTIKYISGNYYRVMHNNMLVTCYINLKKIGSDIKLLTTIAYEIVLELSNFFISNADESDSFDYLITTNNTALMIASVVQAIIEKPVIAIDRLGPIPSSQLHSENLRKRLKGKKLIVIEEVTATGNEVDRAILFLHNLGAVLERIIAVYNLEVGSSMLAKKDDLISLCKPRKELRYVYRSQ